MIYKYLKKIVHLKNPTVFFHLLAMKHSEWSQKKTIIKNLNPIVAKQSSKLKYFNKINRLDNPNQKILEIACGWFIYLNTFITWI